MLVRGQAQHLYHRSDQRRVLEEAYPRQKESPGQETSDAEGLMFAFMGEDQEDASPSVGGPLYPPIHALWFCPIAWLPPQSAYRLVQCLNLAGAFAAGLGLTILSRGRIWWPLTSVGVMLF